MVMQFRQRGFTLTEIMISLLIMSILSIAGVTYYHEEARRVMTEVTGTEIWAIGDAAKKYYADNDAWPGAPGCATALAVLTSGAEPYLQNIDNLSPWYDPTDNPAGVYATTCTANTFSVAVSTNDDWAATLANTLAVTTATGPQTVTTFPLPSSVPALAGLLHRASDPDHPEYNRMEADLDMNGQDISNIGIASGENFASTIKGRSLTQSIQDATVACHNSVIQKPTCPAGQTPQIFVTPMQFQQQSWSPKAIAAVQSWAQSINASQWRVYMRVLTADGYSSPTDCRFGQMTVFTKCS